MNRILYVARKAKGLTEQKMATFLEVDETTYKEMELCLADISAAPNLASMTGQPAGKGYS